MNKYAYRLRTIMQKSIASFSIRGTEQNLHFFLVLIYQLISFVDKLQI